MPETPPGTCLPQRRVVKQNYFCPESWECHLAGTIAFFSRPVFIVVKEVRLLSCVWGAEQWVPTLVSLHDGWERKAPSPTALAIALRLFAIVLTVVKVLHCTWYLRLIETHQENVNGLHISADSAEGYILGSFLISLELKRCLLQLSLTKSESLWSKNNTKRRRVNWG